MPDPKHIVYCIHSLCNPGGMERVLLNKAAWLVEKEGWKVTVVTTDQRGRPPFYPVPKEIRMVDLGIDYSEDNGKPLPLKILGYLRRRIKHRKRLSALLMEERPDILSSLYPCESSFIPRIKDGSRKVLELHLSKGFRQQYGRKGLVALIDRWRDAADAKLAAKFDKFVVLTKEDAADWGTLPNLEVIPNAARELAAKTDARASRRVVAVGRLDFQKGFDRLVEAWRLLKTKGFEDWNLDIFGQGEWKEMLQTRIDEHALSSSLRLNQPTKTIEDEYSKSAFLVMTSNYEGLPMVMVEAMAAGLPVVSFDFKCGPKDLIDGSNGIIVPNGDIEAFTSAMARLMEDEELRASMSEQARKVVGSYSEESVMRRWTELLNNLCRDA